MSTDRIEKTVVVQAPRSRVWRALAEAGEFGVDYSAEPTTLVEFRLEDAPRGTRVTVVESASDAIPLARRAKALRDNERGWAQQVGNLARHVSG